MSGPEAARELRECIIKLCKDLKPEAVALVDALAPPDFILNSVLGASNGDVSIGYFEIISRFRIPNLFFCFGQVYKNLQASLFSNPGVFERPSWWEEVVHWRSKLPAKL